MNKSSRKDLPGTPNRLAPRNHRVSRGGLELGPLFFTYVNYSAEEYGIGFYPPLPLKVSIDGPSLDPHYSERYTTPLNINISRLSGKKRIALLTTAVVAALLIVAMVDVIVSFSRLNNIEIVIEAPEAMVADGTNKQTIGVSVAENGKPRGGDMIQCWILEGGGKLLPSYFFLDENGQAEIWFTPTRLSVYSAKTAVIAIEDISIGRIIEVRKKTTVSIDLEELSSCRDDEIADYASKGGANRVSPVATDFLSLHFFHVLPTSAWGNPVFLLLEHRQGVEARRLEELH